MGDQTKKISFGFSKLAKKSTIVSSQANKIKDEDVSKVEFIDCLEGKSIKLKDPVIKDQGPLIIPLTRAKEGKSLNAQVYLEIQESQGKGLQNKSTNEPSETENEGSKKNNDSDKTIQNDSQTKLETLDEIAAREILEELNRKKAEDEEKRVFSVPLTSNAPSGEKESTLEDYENVPVGDFGMAMLRGMGWAPGKGIGKTEKLVAPTLPKLRPKGMGLGADKVIQSVEKKSSSEDLKMVKGSFIRVLAGSEKDAYGQIEGFDDESGRLIVKLTLKNISISLNEFMVQLVDANEFKKNSKVINVSKYEKYKEDEVKKESSGPRLHEEVQEKTGVKEPLSLNQPEKCDDKSKVLKKSHSSPSDSSEDNLKNSRTKESRSAKYQSPRRSSDSPIGRSRIDERSQSRGHKYQSTSHETSSKSRNKSLTSDGRKHRSYSSHSSDSSSSYRNSKTKSKSSKTKKFVKDRSVSQRRSNSNSSFSSDSSGRHSKKKKNKHKQKKSSSNKYKSRSRSRSPRNMHKRSKKHY